MNWPDCHFQSASKFRLRLLATRAYDLVNPELGVKVVQEYTSAIGDFSKDSLISECRRLRALISARKLCTKNAELPAPPPFPYFLTAKDDCGCGMLYPSC